jgi:hypothetical protein
MTRWLATGSLLIHALIAKAKQQGDRREEPVSPPWAGEVPPFVLPTVALPQRTPGMALVRERVGLQMAGLMPHTSHRSREDFPRVRAGWVAVDVTQEFRAIVARSYEGTVAA